MTEALSPFTRKVLAAALAVVALWSVLTGCVSFVGARIELARDNSNLRERFQSIHSRRIELKSLEAELRRLASAPSTNRAALITDTDRTALVQLQQSVRKTVDAAGAKLLSIAEAANNRIPSSVGTQVRVRIRDSQLPGLIVAFEQGEPHLTIEELSLQSKGALAGGEADLEVGATLRAKWIRAVGS